MPLAQTLRDCYESPMSLLTIEVAIDHGRVTPIESATLPDVGRGLLTILPAQPPAASGELTRFQRWVAKARGSATSGLTTDQIMAMTCGED